MGGTFGEKFEEALTDRKAQADRDGQQWGLRTLARELAGGDKTRTSSVLRQLHKYRPKKPGGGVQIVPTEPTRHDIEAALGLERDALKPDPTDDDIAASQFGRDINALLERRVREILEARLLVKEAA